MKRITSIILFTLIAGLVLMLPAQDWQPVPVANDPLVRMPGTQPDQGVSLEGPGRCLNCHSGYNEAVEPGHNWQGSMMAQSARDPLFWACMTVAAQDSVWALGDPNATDICIRCHFPQGWLGGRSDPTNASLMSGSDYDGVQCDFCHAMVDPFFDETFSGIREGNDWLSYWDETNQSDTPSDAAALETWQQDTVIAAAITMFNGQPFYELTNGILHPASAGYTEAGSGQYYVDGSGAKRGSFADAAARHRMYYSRFHRSQQFCATCHDVSNPILANLGSDPSQPLATELNAAHSFFHVERTFSEFMLSSYGQQGGAAGIGPFAPDTFQTSMDNNFISRCQDCHMRDVVGVGANKNGAPVRPTESIEHPESGQPLHDLTGGNVFISTVLASAVPGSPNHDPIMEGLLNQGPAALTLDLSQGLGIDAPAMLDGADRAKQQLLLAAAIENVNYDAITGQLSFHVQNQTGHRLISGFPEGRRMFLNIRALDASGNVLHEINPYDMAAGTLVGLEEYEHLDPDTTLPPLPLPRRLNSSTEEHEDDLIYEMHPSSSLTGEEETFHFALGDGRWKDNRIPPRGFDMASAVERLCEPVDDGESDPDMYTAAECAGGYDAVTVETAPGAAAVEINLYYQSTSREYIEFLRNEINGDYKLTLSDPSPHGMAAYRAQTDPFFSQMSAWGDTIWLLWKRAHQTGVEGAVPVLMAQATVGEVAPPCEAPTPTILQAVPGNGEATLVWADETITDGSVVAYNIYHDQSGKLQFVASVSPPTTMYTETNLLNGQEICYRMTTTVSGGCESAPSDSACVTPTNQGQGTSDLEITALQSGAWQTTGQGRNKTTVFVLTDSFNLGDGVVLQAVILDGNTGQPIQGASAEFTISGPESQTLSANTDANGLAETTWNTQTPNKRGNGGTTPGSYTVTITALTASGHTWNGSSPTITFTLQ